VELVTLKKKLLVLGRLGSELCFIKQRISNEQNPVSTAKMVDVYGKMPYGVEWKGFVTVDSIINSVTSCCQGNVGRNRNGSSLPM
jgi:hypothetical protein